MYYEFFEIAEIPFTTYVHRISLAKIVYYFQIYINSTQLCGNM